MAVGATHDIAEWVSGASLRKMPGEVREAARRALLDTAGTILAGVSEPVARIVAEVVAEDGARPQADRLGARLRTSIEGAALVNGVSGHALDYDDVNLSAQGHPSVVILPAALAVAQAAHASGRALLEAYIVGVEVMAKLGRAMGTAHYRAGWHATSTLGTLGAASAAGKLLGLDTAHLEHALAIAVSEASGSRQNFGTMTKPFHPGHAARCGILAARLAGKSMTADVTALEAPLGFFALFSFGEAQVEDLRDGLGNPYDLVSPGLSMKKYPCCFATHRVADGVLDLIAQHEVPAGDVESVVVTVPAGGLAPLIRGRPRTGLEGKFSMQYVVSAAVLDRRLTLETFTESMVRRPEVQHFLERVKVVEDSAIPVSFNSMEEGYVEVRMHLRNGDEVYRRIEHPRGSPQAPVSHEELLEKFRDCARRALPAEQVERAIAVLEAVEDARDTNDLVAVLVPADGAV